MLCKNVFSLKILIITCIHKVNNYIQMCIIKHITIIHFFFLYWTGKRERLLLNCLLSKKRTVYSIAEYLHTSEY